MNDFVFKYKINTDYYNKPFYSDKLLEMFRLHIRNLLNVVELCANGINVNVDGFKMLNDSSSIYAIFPETFSTLPPKVDDNHLDSLSKNEKCDRDKKLKNASYYEPRLDYIACQLEALLQVISLENEKKEMKIDGFRLNDLQDWIVNSSPNPAEVFLHLATNCNCNCVFCYIKGNPESIALGKPSHTPQDEYQEILTRIKYHNPSAMNNLFPSSGSPCEIFCSPYAIEALTVLRNKTNQPFRIPTNGSALSDRVISDLDKLKPIFLDISLNSSNCDRRERLMNDRNSEIAINSIKNLNARQISYSVVTVPWPLNSVEEMLEDLRDTVAYANENSAYMFQVNLPGYSHKISPEIKPFERDSTWKAIVNKVWELRKIFKIPIVIRPGIYEEIISGNFTNKPEIIGVVQNSPAWNAGLLKNDIIMVINGIKTTYRPEARKLLTLIQESNLENVTIIVKRDSEIISLVIDLNNYSYPYQTEFSMHLGIIFTWTGFKLSYLDKLRNVIVETGARKTVVLTSEFMKPFLEKYLHSSQFCGISVELDFLVPQNTYFGGNIVMGDLLVVEDFIDCIENYLQNNDTPDLIAIPSSPFSLSGWGRDLTGKVYLDIQRKVNIPVCLVKCEPVYD